LIREQPIDTVFQDSSKKYKGGLPVDVHLKPKEARTLLPTDVLFQTAFWSQVKSQLGWKALAFDFSSSNLRGDVLVLTKTFGNNITAAYVPQGPEFGPHPDDYGLFLEALSDAMISHLSTLSVSFSNPQRIFFSMKPIHVSRVQKERRCLR